MARFLIDWLHEHDVGRFETGPGGRLKGASAISMKIAWFRCDMKMRVLRVSLVPKSVEFSYDV